MTFNNYIERNIFHLIFSITAIYVLYVLLNSQFVINHFFYTEIFFHIQAIILLIEYMVTLILMLSFASIEKDKEYYLISLCYIFLFIITAFQIYTNTIKKDPPYINYATFFNIKCAIVSMFFFYFLYHSSRIKIFKVMGRGHYIFICLISLLLVILSSFVHRNTLMLLMNDSKLFLLINMFVWSTVCMLVCISEIKVIVKLILVYSVCFYYTSPIFTIDYKDNIPLLFFTSAFELFYSFLIIATIIAKIFLMYSSKVTEVQEIKKSLNTDELTGLYSKKYIYNEISKNISTGTPLSLLFIDIDHFKSVNDTYGHEKGDEVLKGIASCLKCNIRTSDISARFGGEEFVILLPNLSSEKAFHISERIRCSIDIDTKSLIHVTVSIGIYTSTSTSTAISANEIIAAADNAMYEAKKTGRNRTVIYRNVSD